MANYCWAGEIGLLVVRYVAIGASWSAPILSHAVWGSI